MTRLNICLTFFYVGLFCVTVWPGIRYQKLTEGTSIQVLSIKNGERTSGRAFCLEKGVSFLPQVKKGQRLSLIPNGEYLSCQLLCGSFNNASIPTDFDDVKNFSNIKKILLEGSLFISLFKGKVLKEGNSRTWFMSNPTCEIEISKTEVKISKECSLTYNYFHKVISLSRSEILDSLNHLRDRINNALVFSNGSNITIQLNYNEDDLCRFGCCESDNMRIILEEL